MEKVLVAFCESALAASSEETEQCLHQSGFLCHRDACLCSPLALKQLAKLCKSERPEQLVVVACQEVIRQENFPEALKGCISRSRLHLVDCAEMTVAEALAAAIRARLDAGAPKARRRLKHRRVLVIGGGVGGCQVALDLADAGIPVSLLETQLSIGGFMAKLDKTFPTLD
ncbi:MAG: hypothetical protein ACLFVT_05015, partial [Syntrophobacteria bacterium]